MPELLQLRTQVSLLGSSSEKVISTESGWTSVDKYKPLCSSKTTTMSVNERKKRKKMRTLRKITKTKFTNYYLHNFFQTIKF